jgi:outer membrane receptor protein involved in Fe transport
MAGAQESRPAPAAPATVEPQPATAAPSGADTPAARSTAEEEIVVTGTRVRRKDLTTPAPLTILTRQQLEESGKVSIGDFLQMLPEQGNAPNFQVNNGGATYSADGATRINLRSLGVTRTLVLVNGRRYVNSGVGASPSVDLNSIPAAAVERIEVLKDGASAIYGSDAIAGVVNVITRKSFNGTQTSAQYGAATAAGDARTFDAQVTTGRSGQFGNFLFSVGFFDQGDSWLRDRPWSANALTYDYTLRDAQLGGSSRTPQGTIRLPQDISDPKKSVPVPDCLPSTLCGQLVALYGDNWRKNIIRVPGASRDSPAGWRLMTGNDAYNFAAENYLTIPSQRIQAYSAGDTRFGSIRPYYELTYVQRNMQQNAAPMPLSPGDYSLTYSKDSIYNPFGVDLSFAGRRLVEFGHREYREELGTFRVVTGVDGTLSEDFGPLRGWYWDASVNYGRSTGTFTTAGALRNSRIADALGPSMRIGGVPRCVRTPGNPSTVIAGCTPVDLLGGPNNGTLTSDQIAGLSFEGTSRAYDALFAVGANATGELFKLMSDRPVSLAFGYEFRRQSGAQIADPIAAAGDSADFNFTTTQGAFKANEAYAELSIPLLANAPGVRDLEASVAGRFVNYTSFGSNFTYKFGARYRPIDDVTVRGTFSTAFRAPTINELFLGNGETAPTVRDPCNFSPATVTPELKAQCVAHGAPAGGSGDSGNQQLAHVGGNANLKAETARIFTAGLVLQPRMVRDLSVTVDYYSMWIDDPVGTTGLPAILRGCYPGPGGTSYEPYCNLITRSGGTILFVTDLNKNLAQIRTSGVDFAVRYALPTDFGRFGLAFDGNWLAKFDRDQDVGPTIHGKGNYDLGALPAVKFNVGATWRLAAWSAGAIARYVGTFKECSAFDSESGDFVSVGGLCWLDPSAPARQTRHNWTVDLNASYVLRSPVGRTVLMAGVNNVFNKSPQYVYAAPLANSDPTVYDFVGRFVYGRVQHTF